MLPKKFLLACLLFSVLVVTLFWCIHTFKQSPPLRRDSIPPDAYIVPWMKPSPTIEELNLNPQLPGEPPPFDIDMVMAKALKLDITFRIETPNGTRVVPSTVYLGHDSDYLYIGGKFVSMGKNPYKNEQGVIAPNYFQILFDVANDGVLTTPESGSRFSVYIFPKDTWAWSYSDLVWYSGEHEFWALAENLPHKTPLTFSFANAAVAYDNTTQTVIILFSRFLQRPENYEINALQMRSGERWVMGFLLELGYATWTSGFGDYVDGWPQKAYPYLSKNCSWWPKLCIDLTNPPPEFK